MNIIKYKTLLLVLIQFIVGNEAWDYYGIDKTLISKIYAIEAS